MRIKYKDKNQKGSKLKNYIRQSKYLLILLMLLASSAAGEDCDKGYIFGVLANDFHAEQIETGAGGVKHEVDIKVLGVTSDSVDLQYTWDKGEGVTGFLIFGDTPDNRFYTFNSWVPGKGGESPLSYFNLEPDKCRLVSEPTKKGQSRTIIDFISKEEYKVYTQSLNEKGGWSNGEYVQHYTKVKGQ